MPRSGLHLMVRTSRVAPQYLAVALVRGVAQLPHVVLPLPQMGRTEPVGQVHEVGPVHLGLLEQLGCMGEMLLVDGEILHDLLFEPVGVFAVELLAQRLALFQGDLVVADLLGGIVGGAADAVLGVGRVDLGGRRIQEEGQLEGRKGGGRREREGGKEGRRNKRP